MKNLVIDTINQEIRIFNEIKGNWETQKFSELQLENESNFATQIEEIQERINDDNDYEVVVVVECFGRTFNIELFENTMYCKGTEIFDPETNQCYFKSANNELLFNCIDKNWDISELKIQKIDFPDGHGTKIKKDGYVYVLDQSDYDVYDIYNLAKR